MPNGLPHEAYGGLTILTFQIKRSQSVVFVLTFQFESQISDLALIAEATKLSKRAELHMLYCGLLATGFYLFVYSKIDFIVLISIGSSVCIFLVVNPNNKVEPKEYLF